MKGFQIPNKIPKLTVLLFIPLFLTLVLVCLILSFSILKIWIDINNLYPTPFKISQEAKMPIIKTDFVPEVSATEAIIMDADSKVVLYAKNPNVRSSTASTIKIMTALTALDYFKLSDILTTYKPSNDGSVLGLIQNEKMNFENLLYAMLLPSANDAALTIAQNYLGGQDAFIKAMNQKATMLELYNIHYSDPAGLVDQGDYTTPFDLARLASFAMQNSELRKIVGTKEKVISDTSGIH